VVSVGQATAVQSDPAAILDALGRLRTELVEAAYALDLRGQQQAADVAMTTAARLAELREEYASRAGFRPRIG
jgi:hypothetical protein